MILNTYFIKSYWVNGRKIDWLSKYQVLLLIRINKKKLNGLAFGGNVGTTDRIICGT